MRLNDSKDIAEAVRKARKALRWSQSDLADKVGTTQAVISRFESSGEARIDTLLKITEALDLQLLMLQKRESPLWDD
ncbi:helix-turn-helix domain-containing protein [Pseudidiomarina homiensis]|uniref:Transcriptional regulator n=1 Tax=Pseudidiomarina homiensis TaxID=364198 RepID=A0A432XXR3_9GAMM|nr:helix-turn-helix domain-containing protein [Pseudidiomarina homiensis]RUO53510.1 transcriptional regulator [Pseudidiomarina homiensis]